MNFLKKTVLIAWAVSTLAGGMKAQDQSGNSEQRTHSSVKTEVSNLSNRQESRIKYSSELVNDQTKGELAKNLTFTLVNRTNITTPYDQGAYRLQGNGKTITRTGLSSSIWLWTSIGMGLATTLEAGEPIEIAGYMALKQKLKNGMLQCRIQLPTIHNSTVEVTLRARHLIGKKFSVDWMWRINEKEFRSRLDLLPFNIVEINESVVQLLIRLDHKIAINQPTTPIEDFVPAITVGTRVKF